MIGSRTSWLQRLSAIARRDTAPRLSGDPADEDYRAGTYPAPYPDGWYVLARSRDVRKRPVFVQALGQRFVLFRHHDDQVAVLDASCPHLGANLADGKVIDDCIECPFHRWRFGPDGRAASIPYGKRLAASMATRSWAARERYGQVFVYYSSTYPERRPTPEPPYAIPELPELEDGRFRYLGKHDPGEVRMHLIEFAENSVDYRHFQPLHGDMFIPWTPIRVPGVQVLHEASWEPDPDEPHVSWFRNSAQLAFLGKRLQGSEADAAIRFHGPGGVVTFSFDLQGKGKILVFQTHTPIRPLAQYVRFTWFAETHLPRLLVLYVVGSWITQWREDVRIWERKVYHHKPMLTQGDGPVHDLRRWFRQFYPTEEQAQPRRMLSSASQDRLRS